MLDSLLEKAFGVERRVRVYFLKPSDNMVVDKVILTPDKVAFHRIAISGYGDELTPLNFG